MIERIGFLSVVYVSDQREALKFYMDKLGLEKVRDEEYRDGLRWVEVAALEDEKARLSGAHVPTIALIKPEDTEQPNSHIGGHTGIAFVTYDIEETCKTLQGRGVRFERGPTPRPWEGCDAQFLDEDNNKLLLIQYHKRPGIPPKGET